MAIDEQTTVHLGTARPRDQFLALYRLENPNLDELTFAIPEHNGGDLVAWIVPGSVPAVLNIEVFAMQGEGEFEVEDSAGWNLRGVAVAGIERRLGRELPQPPATLTPDLGRLFLEAYTAEHDSPTPWYILDQAGCWDAVGDKSSSAQHEWRCECCRTLFNNLPMTQARAVLQPHATNETLRGFMMLCANCHAMAHDPYTESMAELVMAHRPPCPRCDCHTVAHLMFGMPPGPLPGVIAMGCVVTDDPSDQANCECLTCGHTWVDEGPGEEPEETFLF